MGVATATASAGDLHFSKMHGAGNDFVVVDLRGDPELAARLSNPAEGLCRALADRHTGIGCDQILGIDAPRSAGAVASYRIWNADGSPAAQCGNGARCVAAWLVRDGVDDARFALDSPAGSHGVERAGDGRYTIAMGTPRFEPAEVPLAGLEPVEHGYTLRLELPGGRCETVHFGAVSMGNPHAVIVVDDIARAPTGSAGPALQQHAAFPESVNVGFAQVLSRTRIALRVYERGVGETRACGSGACAAVAVLTLQGRVDGTRGVAVALPGGELHIHYDLEAGSVYMTGPAEFVFEGDWKA
jgi:diaminopimelate epimerase